MMLIAEDAMLDRQRHKTGVSLLFAGGTRPSAADVDAVLGERGEGLPAAMISHRPEPEEGWLELLASGLTFELHGLAPALGMPVTAAAHAFGFTGASAGGLEGKQANGLEAVALVTGPHIAGGRAMMPVVRTIAGLAADLAMSLPVQAVCWESADSWMEPRYFARAIVAWLAGGPFPVLGLTTIGRDADGFVTSAGLGFFSGQEVRVAPHAGEASADAVKLAIRVIDNVIRRGPILERTQIDAPSGASLIAEPSADGGVVTVWRGR